MDDHTTNQSSDSPSEFNQTDYQKKISNENFDLDYDSQNENTFQHNSKWDGSEAEFVSDENAFKYKQQDSGIKLDYKLEKKEVYNCLKRIGLYEFPTKGNVIKTLFMSFICISCFTVFSINGRFYNLILGFVSIFIIFLIWFIPYLILLIRAKKQVNEKKVSVKIYPDQVIVNSTKKWVIPLDYTSRFQEFDDMLVLITPDFKIFSIPIRAIEPNVIADIQAMLVAGTLPYNDQD